MTIASVPRVPRDTVPVVWGARSYDGRSYLATLDVEPITCAGVPAWVQFDWPPLGRALDPAEFYVGTYDALTRLGFEIRDGTLREVTNAEYEQVATERQADTITTFRGNPDTTPITADEFTMVRDGDHVVPVRPNRAQRRKQRRR